MVLLAVVKSMSVLSTESLRKFSGGFTTRTIWLKTRWSSCNAGSARGILFLIRVRLHTIVFSDLTYDFKSQRNLDTIWKLRGYKCTTRQRSISGHCLAFHHEWATSENTIIPFICPLKFCISIISSFSWDLHWSQEKTKTMHVQNLGRQTKSIMVFSEVA